MFPRRITKGATLYAASERVLLRRTTISPFLTTSTTLLAPVSSKVGNAFEEASASSDSEVFESIKGAVKKAKEIDSEYDLVGKSAALATASATLAEAAIEKVDELNTKYDFVNTTKKLAKDAAAKAREAANN